MNYMNLNRTVIPRHGAISICLSLRAHRGNLLNSTGIPSRDCRAALVITVIKAASAMTGLKKSCTGNDDPVDNSSPISVIRFNRCN